MEVGLIRLQKSSARRTFVTLLSGFVFVVVLVFAVKISLNYIGVCTRGPEFWRWHRISNAELIAFLELKGTSNAGVQTEYSVAEPYSVPGDHYQPASFIDKIRGRAATLARFYKPWMDNGQYLHPSGYFYTPNCLQGWRPPT